MEKNMVDEMQSYYFLLGEKIILPLSTREMFLGFMLLFSSIILFLAVSFAEVNISVSINSELTKHRGDFFVLTQRPCLLNGNITTVIANLLIYIPVLPITHTEIVEFLEYESCCICIYLRKLRHSTIKDFKIDNLSFCQGSRVAFNRPLSC